MLSWKQSRIHRAMCWRLGVARSFRCRQCARERPAVSGGGRNRRPKVPLHERECDPIRVGSLPVELGKWLRRTYGTPSL